MALTNVCAVCGSVQRTISLYCGQCGNPLPGLGTGLLTAGALLQGRYRIVRKLGQGGQGAVYEVADTRLGGRHMALKEMSDAAILDPHEKAQAIAAFQQEAQLLAHLSHPNIPQVTDFFTDARKHYIVMEFVTGETLEERMARQPGPCAESEVCAWALQLCEVLDYLHSQQPPIIFRDLKPANLMVTPAGQIKLIDFGIARLFQAGKSKDTQALGTPGYAPPEQYGHGQTAAYSDLYSLGVVLHHLLTTYDPVATPFQLPPVRQLNPAVSPPLEQVIRQATQTDPAQRYQNVTAMRRALQGNPLPAVGHGSGPGSYPPAPSAVSWGKWLVGGLLGTLVVLALGVGLGRSIARAPSPAPITLASATPLSLASPLTITPLLVVDPGDRSAPPTPTRAGSLPTLRDTRVRYALGDLASIANAELDFLAPPTGKVVLGDIPFLVRASVFKSQASTPPHDTAPTRARVVMEVEGAFRLHLLLNTGNGLVAYHGQMVGQLFATCNDTTELIRDLRLGEEVREWQVVAGIVSTSTVGRQVWEGARTDSPGSVGHIDLLTVELPKLCATGRLTAVELVDTSTTTNGSLDPALNLIGLTVEHSP